MDDLIPVGRAVGARGVAGTLRIMPYAGQDTVLSGVKKIVLLAPTGQRALVVKKSFWQGPTLMLDCVGIETREQAEALKGTEIGVARADFPHLPEDEFYQLDLLGFTVVNAETEIGILDSFIDNSAQAVMCIRKTGIADEFEWIPFVPALVLAVDVKARRIVVDWVS